MKKELIVGMGAIATVAAVGGAAMFFLETASDKGIGVEEQASETNAEDAAKILALNWEKWRDADAFGFCVGDAKIETTHTDHLLGQEGSVSHTSRELLLFNKEAEKLYVLTRNIEYAYEGSITTMMGEMPISVQVSEGGSLHETYTVKDMPIRLDYSNKYIASDPTTKSNTWVHSSLQEGELVTPHIGCAGVYQLDNTPGKDVLVGDQNVIVERTCTERGVAGAYEGTFSYKCTAVDYDDAKKAYDAAAEDEALRNSTPDDASLFEGAHEPEDPLIDAVKQSESRRANDSKKPESALDRMRDELKSTNTQADRR